MISVTIETYGINAALRKKALDHSRSRHRRFQKWNNSMSRDSKAKTRSALWTSSYMPDLIHASVYQKRTVVDLSWELYGRVCEDSVVEASISDT